MTAIIAIAWPDFLAGALAGAAAAWAAAWFVARGVKPRGGRNGRESLDDRFAADLLDRIPALIMLFGGDGRLLFVNRPLAELWGESPEALRGQDGVARFVPAEEQAMCRESIRAATAQSAPGQFVGTVLLPDGSRRQIEWQYRTWRDPQGQLIGIVGVGRDITELRRAQDEAMQSQRLAAIGQMMAGLAHESRNFLQRSQACLEMLATHLAAQPEPLDLVYRVQIALDQLHRLYEDVRRYAAPVVLNLECVNLREVLLAAWDQLEPMWSDRNVALRCEPSDTPWACHADRYGIQGVFRNILENALSACSDPVEIHATCRFTTVADRPSVEIVVQDNGPGLSPEVQRRLFQPFFTTKTHGTGLGMSIVHRIVESHGGQITAASDTAGARLTIILPFAR